MRKPTVAPKLDQLLKSQKFDLLEIIKKAPGALFEGRYLHWDELQYREPPGGLSREEYWFLTKLKRQASRQMVPLVDKNGEPFNYTSVDPIPQRLHEIDLRLGGQVKMPEPVTNRETRDEYYVNSLIQEAITSSQLEGATTTRQVAKEMLRTSRPPRDRSERMILNNFLTMKRISALKGDPLTPHLLLELHRIITEESLDDPTAAGRFRRNDELIVVGD